MGQEWGSAELNAFRIREIIIIKFLVDLQERKTLPPEQLKADC